MRPQGRAKMGYWLFLPPLQLQQPLKIAMNHRAVITVPQELVCALQTAKHVVVFTGARVSAESGCKSTPWAPSWTVFAPGHCAVRRGRSCQSCCKRRFLLQAQAQTQTQSNLESLATK